MYGLRCRGFGIRRCLRICSAYYFVCLREKRGLSLSVLQPELISRKVLCALKVGSTASACRRTTDDSYRCRWPFYPVRVGGCTRLLIPPTTSWIQYDGPYADVYLSQYSRFD